MIRNMIAVLGAALPLAASAAPVLDAKVRELVEARVAKGELASVVIGLTDGKDSAVYGFGKVAGKTPDGKTVYEIGSISKTFTAQLLANAVQAGQVTLDAPLTTLLPGFKLPVFEEQQIALVDLATQTSGLPRLPLNLVPRNMADPYADYDATRLRDFLAGYTLARKPGASYEYSNLGYGLLGYALASKAGKSYEALVQEKITGPLGMTSTAQALSADMRTRLAPGHGPDGKPAANWEMDALAGAGALRSDADDMLRHVSAFMKATDGAYSLARQPLRNTEAANTRIALGWHITPVRKQEVVWHTGATGGYGSFAGFTADGKLGVVILTNTSANIDSVGMGSLVPGSLALPSTIAMAPEALTQYAGRYQLAPGFELTVTPAAPGLKVQATGQPAFIANASAQDEFFLTVVEARLSFKRNAAGAIESVVLHQGGRAMPAPRVVH